MRYKTPTNTNLKCDICSKSPIFKITNKEERLCKGCYEKRTAQHNTTIKHYKKKKVSEVLYNSIRDNIIYDELKYYRDNEDDTNFLLDIVDFIEKNYTPQKIK